MHSKTAAISMIFFFEDMKPNIFFSPRSAPLSIIKLLNKVMTIEENEKIDSVFIYNAPMPMAMCTNSNIKFFLSVYFSFCINKTDWNDKIKVLLKMALKNHNP